MKANFKSALTLIAGAALGAAAIQGLHAQAKPPTYLVVDMSEISDPEPLKVITQRAIGTPSLPQFGGRYVMRTDKFIALEGTPPARFVVLAFDNAERATAFNNSPSQQETAAIRHKTSKSRVFLVEGMAQ